MGAGLIIDTHCHILPSVDDGAKSLEEAMQMAKMAIYNGITTVIATPHHARKDFFNPAKTVVAMVQELNLRLQQSDIPLQVLPGQEFHLTRFYKQELLAGHPQVLGDSKYLLVELPSRSVPDFFSAFIEDMKSFGMIPVVAHPERNLALLKEPSQLYEWIGRGVLFQVTASSLLGLLGKRVQTTALLMCRNRWIHLLATDAHNTRTRGFLLREAYSRVNWEIGSQMVSMLQSNAEALANGTDMWVEEPIRPQRRRRFWMRLKEE
jgi:protein-tyrosine phosphatase